MSTLSDLEDKIDAGDPLTPSEIGRLAASPDLPHVGSLGERARRARCGDRVTFVRVFVLAEGRPPADRGEAGEVRLAGVPASLDVARLQVRDGARLASGVPLTGFSLPDLLRLAGGELAALEEAAAVLRHEGLESLAEVPLDEAGDVDAAVRAINAVRHSGLQAWRATVTRAGFADRLRLVERAETIQQQTGAFKVLSPLPNHDPHDQPSTGYDDVRTIAVARLACRAIPSIQVDWQVYGPKLAQVAIAYGADDLDRVSPLSAPDEGRRRSPREEIVRHIRMAFAEPVERDGRFETRP